jgi:hypothetical protein
MKKHIENLKVKDKNIIKIEFFLSIFSIIWLFISSFPHNPSYKEMFIDSGIYAYIAQQINNGKILYKEVWDYKFPGIYYIYAFVFKIFPDSRWTLYFLDIFTNVTMLILIFLILRKFKFENFFWIVSLLFITTYRIYVCFSGGNLTEHFFIFFFLISLYLLLEKPTKIKDFILGNCFIWLLMLKQPYCLIVFVLFLFFKNRIFKGEIRFFMSGCFISFAFFLYIFIRGFPESIDTIVLPFYLIETAQFKKTNFSDLIGRLMDFNYRMRVILFTGPGKQIFMMLVPVLFARDRVKVLFISLLASIFFIYFFTFALYAHYILLLNIPIVIGCIILIRNYLKKLIVLFFIVCSLSSFDLIKDRIFHFKRAFYELVILKDKRIYVHPLVITVSKYIKSGETFFMIPDYCEVYFITGTKSPWRFCGIGSNIASLYKNELIKLIREKPPNYFYLEIPIEEFEKIFELKPDEYKLIYLENNFYRFKIFKYNSS